MALRCADSHVTTRPSVHTTQQNNDSRSLDGLHENVLLHSCCGACGSGFRRRAYARFDGRLSGENH